MSSNKGLQPLVRFNTYLGITLRKLHKETTIDNDKKIAELEEKVHHIEEKIKVIEAELSSINNQISMFRKSMRGEGY